MLEMVLFDVAELSRKFIYFGLFLSFRMFLFGFMKKGFSQMMKLVMHGLHGHSLPLLPLGKI